MISESSSFYPRFLSYEPKMIPRLPSGFSNMQAMPSPHQPASKSWSQARSCFLKIVCPVSHISCALLIIWFWYSSILWRVPCSLPLNAEGFGAMWLPRVGHNGFHMILLGDVCSWNSSSCCVRKHRHSATRSLRRNLNGKELRPQASDVTKIQATVWAHLPATWESSCVEGEFSDPPLSQPSSCHMEHRQAFLTKLCLNYGFTS